MRGDCALPNVRDNDIELYYYESGVVHYHAGRLVEETKNFMT